MDIKQVLKDIEAGFNKFIADCKDDETFNSMTLENKVNVFMVHRIMQLEKKTEELTSALKKLQEKSQAEDRANRVDSNITQVSETPKEDNSEQKSQGTTRVRKPPRVGVESPEKNEENPPVKIDDKQRPTSTENSQKEKAEDDNKQRPTNTETKKEEVFEEPKVDLKEEPAPVPARENTVQKTEEEESPARPLVKTVNELNDALKAFHKNVDVVCPKCGKTYQDVSIPNALKTLNDGCAECSPEAWGDFFKEEEEQNEDNDNNNENE